MGMPARKLETVPAAKAVGAAVVELKRAQPSFAAKMKPVLTALWTNLLPPAVTIAILLGIWQIAFDRPGATLPAPTVVWAQAFDLIAEPFYVAGSQDMGLGWRVLTSLQRVAIGFGLAAVVGVLVGAIVGQSIWAMRGLDPVFQILRTVPPLAWLPISLAAFRDANPSAIFVIFITAIWPILINTAVGIRNIPQDYRNVAQHFADRAAALEGFVDAIEFQIGVHLLRPPFNSRPCRASRASRRKPPSGRGRNPRARYRPAPRRCRECARSSTRPR